MKPIPSQNPPEPVPTDSQVLPVLPRPQPGTYSAANRRSNQSTAQRAYPWLLLLSTGIAAFFCMLYITKPVIAPQGGTAASTEQPADPHSRSADPDASPLLPSRNTLPGEGPTTGDANNQPLMPTPPVHSDYEETNLRVQHILTAEAPGGHVNRIDLNVPVLYRSRHLRWTEAEVGQANQLLIRLMEYQDETRRLKTEGQELLQAWNELVGQSIPTSRLRADSPTLPQNQAASQSATEPAADDAIHIQVSEP